MKNRYPNIALIPLIICLLAHPLFAQVSVGTVSRLSQNAQGVGGDAGADSPSNGVNARVSAFRSNATNFFADNFAASTNGQNQIYVRDLSTGSLTLVSLSTPLVFSGFSSGALPPGFSAPTAPEQGNAASLNPAVSPLAPNGFYALAFDSVASNLSNLPDMAGHKDVFVYFPGTNGNPTFLERISVGLIGKEAPEDGNADSDSPSVTILAEPNRAVVAFATEATNIVTGDTHAVKEIVVATIPEPISTTVSPTTFDGWSYEKVPASIAPNGDSFNPVISGDGDIVVFESQATNFGASVPAGTTQVYLYDRTNGNLVLLSRTSGGSGGNGNSSQPAVSYSGRYVAFRTEASDIVSGGTAGTVSLVRVAYDRTTGAVSDIRRANSSISNVPSDGTLSANTTVSISANGRYVLFSDNGTNLVDGDTNGQSDVFLKDMDTGLIARATDSTDGPSYGPSLGAEAYNTLAADLAYGSKASTLISNDVEGQTDVFLNAVGLAQRELEPNTVLEVPGDVSVSGRKITVGTETFSSFTLSARTAAASSETLSAKKKKKKLRITYKVTATPDSGRRKDTKTRTSKRSQVTLKRLRPGSYTVTYKATVSRGSKTVSSSNTSPPQRITVR